MVEKKSDLKIPTAAQFKHPATTGFSRTLELNTLFKYSEIVMMLVRQNTLILSVEISVITKVLAYLYACLL